MATKRWEDFNELDRWLTGMAKGMTDVIGQQVTDLFVQTGADGIRMLCKDLDGSVLYLPMLVTPKLAQLFISMMTERQRAANELTSDSYKRDMSNDKWLETGESFTFDTEGQFIDGGHRANAIIKSGKPIRTLVVFGVVPEAALVLDSGRSRTTANMLTFHGVQYTQELAGVVPRLLAAEGGRWVSPSRFVKYSREEVLNYLDEHPELIDIMQEAKRRTSGQSRIPRVATTPAGIAIAVLSRAPARMLPEVLQFFDQLTTGVGLQDGSSVLALRNGLMRGASPAWRRASRGKEAGNFTIDEVLAMVFSAWNRRHEANVRTIRIPHPLNEENFPRPKPYGIMHD